MNDRRMQELLAELNQDRGRRPLWIPPWAQPWLTLTIIGGNDLASGQNGIKWIEGTATALPGDYDPDVTTEYADGWGNAYLRINGVLQPKKVLFLNDVHGAFGSPLIEGWPIYSVAANWLEGYNGGARVKVYSGNVL